MRSNRPKPLHPICGRPIVMHAIHALHLVEPDNTVVVVGHGAERVTAKVTEQAPEWAHVRFVTQREQLGTGDAALTGLGALPGDEFDDNSTVVVLFGDLPLLRAETIDQLVSDHVAHQYAATLLTCVDGDPTGYGRIVRAPSKTGDGRVLRIVEQRDAGPDELAIREWNTGVVAFRRDLLGPALRRLSPDNAQHQYYLTDVTGILAELGHQVGTVNAPEREVLGINDRWQLALAEREMRNRTNRHWLLNGVTMLDPRQTFIDVTVTLGRDVTLFPGTILQGSTTVGDGSEIGPQSRLVDCRVAANCTVQHTVADGATIGAGATVGPFAHLPAGTVVDEGAVTGAFYTGLTDPPQPNTSQGA